MAEDPETRETDSELDLDDENIPEVEDLRRDASRGRPPLSPVAEPLPEADSGEEAEDEAPSTSRPRRTTSYRRPPTPSPPPPGDSSDEISSSSSSSGPDRDVWEPPRDQPMPGSSDGKIMIQMKVTK